MYTPLTQDQYQAARKAGFSPSQILENEQKRKQADSGTPPADSPDTASAPPEHDFSKGLLSGAIGTSGQQWLDQPAFDMSQNTSGLPGTIAKSAVNSAKSLGKFAVGVGEFLDPVANIEKVAQVPGAVGGFVSDFSNAADSEKKAQELEAKVAQMRASKGQAAKAPVAPQTNFSDLMPNYTKAAIQTVTPPAIQKGIEAGQETAKNEGLGQGILEGIRTGTQSIAEDPYQLAPALLTLKGVMDNTEFGKTDTAKAIDKTVSKTAAPVIKATSYVAGKVGDFANNVAKFGTSQATGLSPKTITTVLENPEKFFGKDYTNNYTREALGSKVKTAIDTRISDLSETGKQYQGIRNSDEVVLVPKFEGAQVATPVQTMLDKFGLSLDKNGKVVSDAESTPMSSADIASLQDFIDKFGDKEELSANAFLNARKALSNMSSYDAAKTDAADAMARELRSNYDQLGKTQLTNLEQLDAKYSPEVKLLKQIKSDYLKPDGTFKDNAISKLANLTNAGRESVLARLEQIVPGITKEITTLRAVEDIANAGGQKVGAYSRAASAGGSAVALATGNIPAAIGLITEAILASPKIATQILAGWGKLQGIDITGTLDKIFNTDIPKTPKISPKATAPKAK